MNTETYRVLYLILAHKNPGQLRRLMERLQGPESIFWVHVDKNTDDTEFRKQLQGIPGVTYVRQRFSSSWGRYAFTKAQVVALREIAERNPAFDHLVILSGQDYLLAPRQEWIDLLRSHRNESLVHYTPMNEQVNGHLMSRLTKYHLRIPGNRSIIYPYESNQPVKKLLNRAVRLTGRFPLPKQLPLHMQPYFGSNWIRLSRKAFEYIVKTVNEHPEYENFYTYSLLAEEHFFHILLFNATEEERGPIVNNNYTFCHWKRDPSLYKVPLSMSDLDLVMSSGDLLARKFDETFDTKLMDWLDTHRS